MSIRPSVRAVLALAAFLALLWALPGAAQEPTADPSAHQCVDVEILRAPHVAHAGTMIAAAGWVKNCGGPVRGFRIAWVLVDELGDRIQLAHRAVQLAPGEEVHGVSRLLLPDDLRPGVYALVLVGKTPNGRGDRDARRIAIRPAQDAGEGG